MAPPSTPTKAPPSAISPRPVKRSTQSTQRSRGKKQVENNAVILSERERRLRRKRESKDPDTAGPADALPGFSTRNFVFPRPLRCSLPYAAEESEDLGFWLDVLRKSEVGQHALMFGVLAVAFAVTLLVGRAANPILCSDLPSPLKLLSRRESERGSSRIPFWPMLGYTCLRSVPSPR